MTNLEVIELAVLRIRDVIGSLECEIGITLVFPATIKLVAAIGELDKIAEGNDDG